MLDKILKEHVVRRVTPWGLVAIGVSVTVCVLKLAAEDWLLSLLPSPLTVLASNWFIGGAFLLGAVILVAEFRLLRRGRPWVTNQRLWKHWRQPVLRALFTIAVVSIAVIGWRVIEVRFWLVRGFTGDPPHGIAVLLGKRSPTVILHFPTLLDHEGTYQFWYNTVSVEGRTISGKYKLIDLVGDSSKKRLSIYLQTIGGRNYLTLDAITHNRERYSQAVDVSDWRDNDHYQITATWTAPTDQWIALFINDHEKGRMKMEDYTMTPLEGGSVVAYE